MLSTAPACARSTRGEIHSLRTQQRAYGAPRTRSMFPARPEGLAGTDDVESRRTELVSVPPLSDRRDSFGHETALDACLSEAGAKCSLERR